MEFERMKKQIIRDSLIVIPTLLFIAAWIFVEINPNIDLVPGANYGQSVLVNLLIPLAILGIAQIIYASVLMIDCIRLQGKSKTEKVFISIGIWFAVMYLLAGVYIYRLVHLINLKKRASNATQPT